MKNFRKKLLRKASSKAQSAMEYLMTYGWAILIIAVVLAALFQLGIFNPMTFAPKAPPGSCQVFRPNGPYTTSFINLEGICSGELPQYVAQFNGQSSYASAPTAQVSKVNVTLSFWVMPAVNGRYVSGCGAAAPGGDNGTVIAYVGNSTDSIEVAYNSSESIYVNGYMEPCPISAKDSVPIGTWTNVIIRQNSTTQAIFINGLQNGVATTASFSGVKPISNLLLGSALGTATGNLGDYNFTGRLANVQIYNTSLSASEIQALYLEGIGGAPIDLQHLVAWWPLNGNANDYSGNGNNGQIYNVNFVSNWYNGYTPP